MLYAFLIAFAGLVAINLQVGKTVLYPPALFTAAWAGSIGFLSVTDTFAPVPVDSLAVFLCGALALSIGGALAYGYEPPRVIEPPDYVRRVRRILDLVLFVVVAGLPYVWVQATGGESIDADFLAQQRDVSVEAAASIERKFTIAGNLIVLASFLAIALHVENDGSWGRRWRAYLALVLAIALIALTGSKGGVRLIVVLMMISFLRSGIKLTTAALVGVLFCALFAAGVMFVNLNYVDFDITPEMVALLVGTIQNYWLGSLVAFQVVLNEPSMESHHHIGRFFLETANGLGARFYVPSIHAPFTTVAPYLESNTYTIYFSYFKDLGWAGMLALMAALGAFTTFVYRFAKAGHQIALAFYGVFALGLLLSLQAEHFMLDLNAHIKMFLFLGFVHVLASRPIFVSGRLI
jgi:oligosaccharide repeat unit polymerase